MRLPSLRFLIGTLLGASTLLAMEPPDPGMIEAYRKDGTLAEKITFAKSLGNHKVSNGLAARAKQKLLKAAASKGLLKGTVLPTPPDAWKDMPTTGTVKTLTILIDFSDYPHNEAQNSLAQVQARVFGDGDSLVPPPYESYRNFYRRSSYNKLDLQGNVLGWYRAGYTRASMAETTVGREKLIKEALTAFDAAGHDFTQYDNNHDNAVDFMSVIWSGPHGAWSSFWWGYQTSFNDETFKLDGMTFGKYSWQWESRVRHAGAPDTYDGPFTPAVMIHEQGHGLGLPDYYDYDDAVGPRGGLGGFDMMDWICDHNCFSKWLLDWITPEIVDTSLVASATKTLRSNSDYEDALIVMPGASTAITDMSKPFGEFFMIQNRQRTGNDDDPRIAGSGLVVWHVDSVLDGDNFDFVYDNSYTEHKLLRLMEADGLEEIETEAADADAGDFYATGGEIGPETAPNTARYTGQYTYFGIKDISASGPSMDFSIYTQTPDTTPPTGQPTKPSGTTDMDRATFTWTIGTSTDADGKIVGYQLQVGSTSGGSDLFDKIVGNKFTHTISNLGIFDGKPVYARVRAMNAGGLFTGWSDVSDSVTIDLPVFRINRDLDNGYLVFKTIGKWGTDTDKVHTGDTSAHGLALDNESTALQTTVVGPGSLTFWWAGSTEKDFDYYSVQLDGVTQDRISGEQDWALKTVTIPAGTHVVTWRWSKDSNTSGEFDRIWLDDVQYNGDADLNGDNSLDILDLALIARACNSRTGDSNWNAAADLNGDGYVGELDIDLFLTAAGF